MTSASAEPVPLFLPLLRNRNDPVAELGLLRSTRPIARIDVPGDQVPPVWLVTGYDEVRAVLADTGHFSHDLGRLAGTGLESLAAADPGGLGFTDPPQHTKLRRLLTPEFTVRRLQELAPRVEAVLTQLLDAMERQGPPVDLVSDFAVSLPSLVICELLGIPADDRAEFERRSTQRFNMLGSMGDGLDVVQESLAYLRQLVARERTDPGTGLLGRLIREHGDELSDDELAGIADGILTGGHETTASMIALSALVLLEDPELAAGVRSGAVPVEPLVDELLRYLSVVQVGFPRFVTSPLTIGDQELSPGQVVLVSLSGANRDARFGPDADTVDHTRGGPTHFAFGHGMHRCVGAELGRLELRMALPALLRRFPGLELAAPDETEFRMFSLVHGITALPVRW